jgi:para-nitrobenzyl esterase
MMTLWTQFARTGDPNVEGMIQWPAYKKGEDKYLYISSPLEIKTGFSAIKPLSPPPPPDTGAAEKKESK